MYKTASDNAQRQARQLWLRDLLGPEFGNLAPEQQRENLVAIWKHLQTQLLALPRGPKRDRIGQEMHDIQALIHEIRPKRKGGKGVEQHFIDVARETLTAFQFKLMMDEASKRARRVGATAPQIERPAG